MADPNFQEHAKRAAEESNALKLLEASNPSAAFSPSQPKLSRRQMGASAASAAAALLTSPFAATADGAASDVTRRRNKEVYGSRIWLPGPAAYCGAHTTFDYRTAVHLASSSR